MSDLTSWTPVGQRFHFQDWWQDVEGAPVSYLAARKAYDRGEFLMANKHLADRTLMVIKLPKAPRPVTGAPMAAKNGGSIETAASRPAAAVIHHSHAAGRTS